jgi:hypothetical protein
MKDQWRTVSADIKIFAAAVCKLYGGILQVLGRRKDRRQNRGH